jgi:hypothetical protein
VANHFPDVGSGVLHLSQLTYFAQVTGLDFTENDQQVLPSGSFQTGFRFDTGSVTPDPTKDMQVIQWDYSEFDQDIADAQFLLLVDGFAAFVAQAFGMSVEEVRAFITTERIWSLEPNVTGSAAPLQLAGLTTLPQIVELMPYPAASDSDAAIGTDGGEQIGQS